MTDDPREILKAVGMECAEVTRYVVLPETHTRCADAAILVLAKEIAALQWSLDYIIDNARAVDLYYDVPEATIGDRDDVKRCLRSRWEAHNA